MNLKCSFGASVGSGKRDRSWELDFSQRERDARNYEECSKPEGEPISASARVRSRDDAFFLPLHGFHSIAGNAWCSSIRNSTASFPIELALFGLVEIPGIRFSKSRVCWFTGNRDSKIFRRKTVSIVVMKWNRRRRIKVKVAPYPLEKQLRSPWDILLISFPQLGLEESPKDVLARESGTNWRADDVLGTCKGGESLRGCAGFPGRRAPLANPPVETFTTPWKWIRGKISLGARIERYRRSILKGRANEKETRIKIGQTDVQRKNKI